MKGSLLSYCTTLVLGFTFLIVGLGCYSTTVTSVGTLLIGVGFLLLVIMRREDREIAELIFASIITLIGIGCMISIAIFYIVKALGRCNPYAYWSKLGDITISLFFTFYTIALFVLFYEVIEELSKKLKDIF